MTKRIYMNFSDERSTVKLNIYKPDHVIII